MPDFHQPHAHVVADSMSPTGHRLTTIEVTLHRFVLAEINTHRALSRNSASSRAIPVERMFQRVADHPAVPIQWPAEKKGMQGGDDIPAADQHTARTTWLAARDASVHHAEQLVHLGVHKSIVNRLLEPFLPHTIIISATDWDNFYTQRCSPLAQPEIRAAAEAMRTAQQQSHPVDLHPGQWHLPYIDAHDRAALTPVMLRHVSAARCARVSYLTHDGRRDHTADLNLFARLIEADPPHASPLEHVATPWDHTSDTTRTGNFTGWHQLRHLVLGSRP